MNKPANASKTIGPVSDLERHLPSEWWKSLFNSLYLKTDGDVVENKQNTKNEIDLLIEKLKLNTDDTILDLCCGQGRHSLELAERGYKKVTGIDRSRYLIRLARKRAHKSTLQVQFSEGDARKIRLPENSHDCIYLMGNSFGYFEREEDDHKVLESIKRVLRSKGKLALDIVNGEWMLKNYEPRSWEWIDQNQFVCRERSTSNDGSRIVSREVVVHAEQGVIADQFYAERVYTKDQICNLLEKIGFTDITVHEDIIAESTRGQDLGMMANRLFVTAVAPLKEVIVKSPSTAKEILVLFGDPRQPDAFRAGRNFEQEDKDEIDEIKNDLSKLKKFNFNYLDDHRNLLQYLQNNRPTLVMNLCDSGFNNNPELEAHVPALLELLGIPYTGAGPTCLGLCHNKMYVSAIAKAFDIPVPEETYFDPSDQSASLPSLFPALVKPARGDGSIGITKSSFARNAEQLVNSIDILNKTLPGMPLLIQEYLPGPEYTVGVIGNKDNMEVLVPLEADFKAIPPEYQKMNSFEIKFGSEKVVVDFKEAKLTRKKMRQLTDYARILFENLECRDYARFDFRTDKNGVIKLIDANPNPGIDCWELIDGAKYKGISNEEMLTRIIESALERFGINGFH